MVRYVLIVVALLACSPRLGHALAGVPQLARGVTLIRPLGRPRGCVSSLDQFREFDDGHIVWSTYRARYVALLHSLTTTAA